MQTDNWGSPGTWEILSSPRQFPAGDTGLPTPGLGGGTRPPRSEKNECQPRYHQAKATKRGGMGGRKSQHPHITEEAGELVPRDPVEGRKNRKGVSDVGPWTGNYVQGFVLGDTSVATTFAFVGQTAARRKGNLFLMPQRRQKSSSSSGSFQSTASTSSTTIG